MSDIIVDTYNLKQYAQRIGNVNSRISRLDWRLKSLYSKVGLVGLFNLIQADSLTGYSWRLLRCQNYLNQTASDFEITENYIQSFDPTNFKLPATAYPWLNNMQTKGGFRGTYIDNIRQILYNGLGAGIIGYGTAESALYLLKKDAWDKFWSGDLEFSKGSSIWSTDPGDDENFLKFFNKEYSGSIKPEYGKYSDDDALNDIFGIDDIKQKDLKDDTKQINSDEEWYDTDATVFEVKGEAKIEGSVIDAKRSGSNDWAEGSIEAKVLTGEAHASASGGFYVYSKDKDGNVKRVFSPGVSAEVGASVAVVQVEAEGRIGLGEDKNMLGVYGNVDAKAFSAEAQAKAAINSEEVYLGASAEADLVKVSGTAGVSVLGTDVGVSGSFKVGVGAHAEVGYTDGKLKLDIGAAVGVGFDLGLEIDIGGTVDAVCDFASDAWDGAKDVVSDVWDGAKDVVSDAWNGAKDAVSDALDWLF